MTERAIILAGGRGRRLAPYTAILPKPLMPLFQERSIIEHVLEGVARAGISDVVITLGYLGHLIEAVTGDGSRFGLKITYTREDTPLGTAGPLALIAGVHRDDRLLVVNGDTFTDMDYRQVLADLDHADAVIACVPRQTHVNYGVVHFDSGNRMTGYDEKPRLDLIVSTGIYALRATALDLIQPGTQLDMPDLLRDLQSRGRSVYCRVSECTWKDLGRPEDFAELNESQQFMGSGS